MSEEEKTKRRRPSVRTINELESMDGAYVPCRLANGEDVYVPLKMLFVLFEHDIEAKTRLRGGQAWP